MKISFIFALIILLNSCSFAVDNYTMVNDDLDLECVILLHGMGRTAGSMSKIEKYLSQSNYRVVNLSYPSTSETIENIAEKYIPSAIEKCQNSSPKKIHFVTHSLGGIIVRQYLQENTIPMGSRVVMLSPPNKGSEIPDHFYDSLWYSWSTGPAGQQLTTDKKSLPNRLKSIEPDVGVIAGTKSIEPWFSPLIPGKDDGKVSVERTKINEMKDFITVHHTHTFIMQSSEVIYQIEAFLKNGEFEHEISYK